MKLIGLLIAAVAVATLIACADNAANIETDAKIKALETENAELSKEASGLRTLLAKFKEEHDKLKVEHGALRTAPADGQTNKIIQDLEERLDRAIADNEELAAMLLSVQADLANASQSNAASRPAAPVDLSGFSEPEIITDLCYRASMGSYTLVAVARSLAPNATEEHINAAVVEAGDEFGYIYPPPRAFEYLSLTMWTYCTIPYFDEAHHEKMRQRAQARVDAIND